jgi:thioredoxin-dependent peroxiredoxin
VRYPGNMLAPGDKAPELNLQDQDGNVVTLKSLRGRRVCVYFYPKADTPGCTQQSCLLRDLVAEGRVGDVAVIGISPDQPTKQKKFEIKYDLGFPLLSDTEHAVAEAFFVWKEKSLYGKKYMGIERSAFLIDAKGKIERTWYKVSPKDTPVVLLAALDGGVK